ncbi:MAG: CAP domain-containing protein, partial [Planctomycetota bacterium]
EVRTRGTAEAVTSADLQERSNVRAVNEYRWMMGLHAVKLDERLLRAARKHSIEMQQKEYFAHDSPTKHLRTPGMRAKRDGYGGGVSENIARGASSGRQAFEQWFKSSGHHRNMVIPGHTEMGCGAANHHWWTQLFGRMTGRGLSPPKIPPDPDPPGTSGNGMPAPGGGE